MKMVKEITMYKAADGSVWPTDQQAERQSNEVLLHTLESFASAMFTDANRPSIHKAVLALEADIPATKAMLNELLRVIEYGDDE